MFDSEFFPTSAAIIERMLSGENIDNKVILEPSAGNGNIVSYLLDNGAKEVIAAEKHPDLRKILQTKCRVIADDFFTVTSDMISHIDMVVMNPPFSNADAHIMHAYNTAPNGCRIVAICNESTVKNPYSVSRKNLCTTIENYGNVEYLDDCFKDAERTTGVNVALIRITKSGVNSNTEFEGFFMDEEIEEQGNGIMSYNVIRDIVNRYVGAVRIYDEQLNAAVRMNNMIGSFYSQTIGMQITEKGMPKARNDFKKDLQKQGWKYIFNKLDMKKYATQGLKDDINKFVEQQCEIPFTMKNIYRMLDIVIGTTSARMDKAIIEVFDKLTQHTHENRFNVEGWKTNSHYLINKKFIIPNICYQDQRWYKGSKIETSWSGGQMNLVEDLLKALCYITGDKYELQGELSNWIRNRYKIITDSTVLYSQEYNTHYNGVQAIVEKLRNEGKAYKIIDQETAYGEWFDFSYFRCKAFKKGTMHFEFKSEDVWATLNQRIAKIKGYALFEGRNKSARQQQEFNKQQKPFQAKTTAKQGSFNVMFEMAV